MTATRLSLLVGALVLAGCASATPREPGEVVRAHLAAVRAGDERAALAFLTEEARRRAPTLPAPEEAAPAAGAVEVERAARWPGERELVVVRTEGGWKISRGVLALFSVESAEGALQAFARAVEARDFERVYELLPAEGRAFATLAVLRERVGEHKAWLALAAAIGAGRVGWVSRDATAAEASVAVEGAEHRVMLGREEGGWKVFDVLPRSGYLVPR